MLTHICYISHLKGTFEVKDINITRNGSDMCLTCLYQQSSNTGCIVLVISPVSSTILLDITIEKCLSPSVNGTYILYGYDKNKNGERSLKHAVVKEFVVDWTITYSSIYESSGNHGNKICAITTLYRNHSIIKCHV